MAFPSFLVTVLTAIAVENAVFARALGMNRWVQSENSPRRMLWFGGVFTWVALFSTMGSYLFIRLLEGRTWAKYLQPPSFLLCVFFVYVITYFLAKRFLPDSMENIQTYLPLATFNTALFGIFYTILGRNYTFFRSIAYALGTGIGYTGALLILIYIRKRLALSPIPRSFRGIPITLIYLGLLSLALSGLMGSGATS